ncbi:MAG: GTPase ObgE [Desulfatibacillaceae bacterium]
MKFVDEAIIHVRSGDGGAGAVSFRRERFVPKGGPDGGNGGRGGDVALVASERKRTLYDFRFRHDFKAENGRPGMGRQKTGRSGDSLEIKVPPGTVVRDDETGEVLADLDSAGARWVAASGGRGGVGNLHFKSSTHRTPRFAQPGESGEYRRLRLELKLLADVGIIGLPNAGKSSLVTALSAARPKIAPYPFTTLTPTLGVVDNPYGEPFVVADIPGLIEGAHEGAGLGTRFLRHVERTRILLHLVDASAIDPETPLRGFDMVEAEISAHNPALAQKPGIVVLNKLDLEHAHKGADAFESAFTGHVLRISAATHQGLDRLIQQMATLVGRQASTPDES